MPKQYTIMIGEGQTGSPVLKPIWDTTRLFGFIDDDNAQELYFLRSDDSASPDRTGDNLKLYFEDKNGALPVVQLGTENSYLINRNLTQTEELKLQIAFVHDNIETAHSNQIVIRLGKSIAPSDPFIPTPPSDGHIYAWQGQGWLDITERLNEVVEP